ncbi:hypothetical protein N2152v2_010827 [Parachlorella kessleri]
MAYLRLAKIQFSVTECATAASSPTSQVPAVESQTDLVSAEATATAADEFAAARTVIDYLRKRVNLDVGLTGQQRAELLAFATLVETKLEPAILYSTWCETGAYSQYTRVAYGKQLPFPLSYYLPWSQQRSVRRKFEGTSAVQIYTEAGEALEALANHLTATSGSGNFFLGRQPTSLDALLFGCLAFIRGAPVVHEHLRRKLESHRSLIAYLDAIAADYFAHGVPSAAEADVQWSQWEAAGGRHGERYSKQKTAQEAELQRKGKIWLACAAAAIAAYVILGGQYVQFGFFEEEYEEEDED